MRSRGGDPVEPRTVQNTQATPWGVGLLDSAIGALKKAQRKQGRESGHGSTDWLTGTNRGADVTPAPGDAVTIADRAPSNQPILDLGHSSTIDTVAITAGSGTTVDCLVNLGGALDLDLSGVDFILDRVEFAIITAQGFTGGFSPDEVAGLADDLTFTASTIVRGGLFIYQGVVERDRLDVSEPATWLQRVRAGRKPG